MQVRQRGVAALDAKYLKKLADVKAENNALCDDVVADFRQLRIRAVCPFVRKATTVSPDRQPPLNGIIYPQRG